MDLLIGSRVSFCGRIFISFVLIFIGIAAKLLIHCLGNSFNGVFIKALLGQVFDIFLCQCKVISYFYRCRAASD